ncbi:D-glycero-beta-D-manno-heptose 1-phosphate adenylyltransferase [Rubrobacter taiwanensis]|uniref:D-glycero-beta-D-manno-heptose 1-phosphate adenylyltransferase n=1 Tax=Rubrobacter taiwanensis TaxID=185139 RepID=UPI001FB39DE2|nr:D-glycero-beta-D-manno-heptose 1-phosphate adenylyltransferase [Rubrobacter taiwanensis]
MSRRIAVVGDALLDRDVEGRVERVCPDAPAPVVDELERRSRPGGAGLAATLAARDGHRVTLVTALAGDAAGRELAALLEGFGVGVVDLGLRGRTPEKIRVRCGGQTLLRLDRGGAPGEPGRPAEEARRALESADAVLVADYGRGITAGEQLRELLSRLAPDVPVIWDPHPRGAQPVPGVRLATPNRDEAARLTPGIEDPAESAARLAARWRAGAVAVTLGSSGAVLATRSKERLTLPAPPVSPTDVCGAGDRFAAAAAALLAGGAPLEEAVSGAVVSASGFVAAGGAGSVIPAGDSVPEDLAGRVRERGGTVVAAGGCFDLLHAGHVRMLERARRLGDCLIVLLNSDASVRRIKGADRPLVGEEDRAAVLRALGCVDAVLVFDEDTPERALRRIRPHVFAKGGDYRPEELPEARVLEEWGGRVEILPYVEGRSTTRLIREAISRSETAP